MAMNAVTNSVAVVSTACLLSVRGREDPGTVG